MQVGESRLQLAEDWSDEDGATFQVINSLTPPNRLTLNDNNNWCTACSIAAKMSGRGQRSWGQSGFCDTRDCPGYKGHPPASRPKG